MNTWPSGQQMEVNSGDDDGGDNGAGDVATVADANNEVVVADDAASPNAADDDANAAAANAANAAAANAAPVDDVAAPDRRFSAPDRRQFIYKVLIFEMTATFHTLELLVFKAVGKYNVPFHIVHFVSVVGMWVSVPVPPT